MVQSIALSLATGCCLLIGGPCRTSNKIYHLLFRASSQALLKLAQDPRFVGGRIGMRGVLQTWTRDLRYHPHIHYKKCGLFAQVDHRVWKKKWVVDCEPVGNGAAAFKYLAPYTFRVALSNRRLVKFADGHVTFKYKESATHQIKHCTLKAEEFIP